MAQKKNADAGVKKAPELIKVEVQTPYDDLELKKTMKIGDSFEVTKERAAVLLDRKLVKKL